MTYAIDWVQTICLPSNFFILYCW